MVLQHAELPVQLRYRDMLRKARESGDLEPADLAMFEDRVTLRQGGEQIYGTQIVCSDGSCRVDRLTDPMHVDERRKSVGLEPLAEYVRDWNITWDAAEYLRTRNAAPSK
jgi:hypothetical protein